jgi:hypothetical protein
MGERKGGAAHCFKREANSEKGERGREGEQAVNERRQGGMGGGHVPVHEHEVLRKFGAELQKLLRESSD